TSTPSAHSDPVSCLRRAGTPMTQSSLSSSTKGKGTTLDQFKSSMKDRLDKFDEDAHDMKITASMLKHERYNTNINFHMCKREISHLEAERVQACTEADEQHQHKLEMKKSEIELQKVDVLVLDKESEVLRLRIRLVECSKNSLLAGTFGDGAIN
ncbi:hypothetical protein PAXRUDRAFT_161812, partial [Paxillus rubicundulus Ve08.2h10]